MPAPCRAHPAIQEGQGGAKKRAEGVTAVRATKGDDFDEVADTSSVCLFLAVVFFFRR